MEKIGNLKYTLLLLTCILSFASFGQEPKIEAQVSSTTVTVNEIFQLQITSNYNLEFTYPSFDNFQIGPGNTSYSSNVQIMNNKMQKTEAYITTHAIKATKIGTYTIGSISVRYNGKVFGSKPITIYVKEAPKENSTIKNHLSENFYADYVINKTDAYVGEPIYIYKKMYSKHGMDDISQPIGGNVLGTAETKSIGKANTVQTKREEIEGNLFITASFDEQVIFPMKEGDIQIESYSSTISFGGFFGDMVQVKAIPRNITIKPLPANAPDDFTGGVGSYTISSSLNKKSVDVGDVVQLDVEIEGTGNIQLMSAPVLDVPDAFEIYGDPVVEDTFNIDFQGMNGNVKYSYLLKAKKPGKSIVPAVHFSYFNLKSKEYKSIRTDSLSIKIEGDEVIPVKQNKQDKPINVNSEPQELSGQYDVLTNEVSVNQLWSNSIWFKMIPLPLILGFILGFAIKRKEENAAENKNKNRVKKAGKTAIDRFALAKEMLSSNNHSGFYEAMHSAILNFFADKLLIEKSALSKSTITATLTEKNIGNETIQQVLEGIEECEMARFSALDSTGNQQFFEKMSALIQELDTRI